MAEGPLTVDSPNDRAFISEERGLRRSLLVAVTEDWVGLVEGVEFPVINMTIIITTTTTTTIILILVVANSLPRLSVILEQLMVFWLLSWH